MEALGVDVTPEQSCVADTDVPGCPQEYLLLLDFSFVS